MAVLEQALGSQPLFFRVPPKPSTFLVIFFLLIIAYNSYTRYQDSHFLISGRTAFDLIAR